MPDTSDLIHYFAYTKFVLISHISSFITFLLILGFSSIPAAKIFYTTDKFDEYIKGYIAPPKSWRLGMSREACIVPRPMNSADLALMSAHR